MTIDSSRLAPISNPNRVTEAREKLEMLKSQGFQYIATSDEGETWVGSQEPGLEIDTLMGHCFLGRITVNAQQEMPVTSQ